MAKSSGGLSRWFKEEWVDLSRPKKGGGFEPCGRPDADEGKYPKCVPKAKAMKMTQAEIDSAVRRKRRAESTQERKGKKPINVPTEVEKKSKNIPTNPKLYAKVKAEAKRKFDVYPSAYANGWLVQEYKRRGGGYKTVKKQQPASSDVHVPSTFKFKRKKKKRGLSSMVEKHAEHNQQDHGKWAASNQRKYKGKVVSNPKPYAGRNKSLEDGDPPRPLPEVGDRIGIHLDLGGKESDLPGGDAFSIKTINRNGNPRYGTTQAHTLGVRLSDVGTHVSRSGLNDAIKYDRKNPHAAFTGKVEEWVNSREVPKGAVEIDYWVRPKAKNPDGTNRYTAETTGFWYAKDGTYREFIGASDGIGIGGDLKEGGDKARTYVYGDVELGEVNPYVKEWFEEQKLTKAHRLIHESRSRQRPFELAKHITAGHGPEDQKVHGKWARGVGVPEGYVALSAEEYAEWDRSNASRSPFAYSTKAGFLIDSADITPTDSPQEFFEKALGRTFDGRGDVTDYDSIPEQMFLEVDQDDLIAAVDQIFGATITSPDGKQTVTCEVISVKETYGNLEISASIVRRDNETGEEFATGAVIDRRLSWFGEYGDVENELFTLPKFLQGQGIGTSLLRHWEDQQALAGFDEAKVHAVSNRGSLNGGYTWLTTGYEPDSPYSVVANVGGTRGLLREAIETMVAPVLRERLTAEIGASWEEAAASYLGTDEPGSAIAPDMLRAEIDRRMDGLIDDVVRQYTDTAIANAEPVEATVNSAADILNFASDVYDSLDMVAINIGRGDTQLRFQGTGESFEGYRDQVFVRPWSYIDRDDLDTVWKDTLAAEADWYGSKDLYPRDRGSDQRLVRLDAIDADGDGIILEGTEFERFVGKSSHGPKAPKSLAELYDWWADNDPAAWEKDTPEVQASYRRFLDSIDKPVQKHATHDQREHGNWARNRRIFRHIMENEGATFDIRTREFKKEGFAVADPAQAYEAEQKHSSAVFAEEGQKLIGEFIKKWKDELAEPNKYVGAWLDGGNYYLDVATVVMDRDQAIDMGQQTDQIAIWDLGAEEAIRLRKADSRVLLVPGNALNEETIELLFNELMRLNDD